MIFLVVPKSSINLTSIYYEKFLKSWEQWKKCFYTCLIGLDINTSKASIKDSNSIAWYYAKCLQVKTSSIGLDFFSYKETEKVFQ